VIPRLEIQQFIDEEFIEPAGSETIHILDPMTKTPLVETVAASKPDVDKAVSAARNAFDTGPWPRLHVWERAAALLRLSDAIERNAEDLTLLEAIDTGKPIAGVRSWDIPHAAEVYRYYAGWADKITGEVLPSSGNVSIVTRREPVGICAAIIPWNFPFACVAWKIAPALAVGCTVVVKPSERAPLSAQFLAKLIQDAEFPPGVVNVVLGKGPIAGAALVTDPRIDKITFTGDIHTAQSIVRTSASHLPRLTLELGGKNPNVVLDDADLDAAVAGTVDAMFSVQGQNCCAGSRTFVHQPVFDEFMAKLVLAAEQRRLGDPLNDHTEQGPRSIAAIWSGSTPMSRRRSLPAVSASPGVDRRRQVAYSTPPPF